MSEDFGDDSQICFWCNHFHLSHFQKTLQKAKNFLHKLGPCPSFICPQKKYRGLARRKNSTTE